MPSARKIQAGLKRRIGAYNTSQQSDRSFKKPGSQNMKKAYGTGAKHSKPRR